MNVIPLAHRRSLHYPDRTGDIDLPGLAVRDPDKTTVITFARVPAPPRRLDAGDRLTGIPDGDVVLSCFDMSPLAPLLLWDIAHALPAGARLYLQASGGLSGILRRPGYRDAFRLISDDGDMPVWQKIAPLPAEADRGLTGWSFCIPVGDGDPSALNQCVGRILSLGVPDMEILLCGRPGRGFLYPGHVRIIGEDIPAWPLHITRKKNMLARAARYPNLCILHDRVLLPANFYEAVTRFGDDYPFTAFASVWFADRWQAVPRRYSDFGVAASVPAGISPESRLSREQLPALARLSLSMQHPARCDFGRDYLTGSLYLCKRAVWALAPQNEALFWQEYEDIEQGMYAAQLGIPSRLNPYGLTQSLSYRSIMHTFGYQTGLTAGGRQVAERGWGEYLFPRRPHLSVTAAEGLSRLSTFARRYTDSTHLIPPAGQTLNGVSRYRLIVRLLWAARGDTRHLTEDWCRLVLCEALPDNEKEALVAILNDGKSAAVRKLLWLRHISLLRQVYNNPFSPPFRATSPRRENRLLLAAGSFLGAWRLRVGSRHIRLRLSLFSLWRLLVARVPPEGGDDVTC